MRKFLLLLLMPIAVLAQPGKKVKKIKPAPVKAVENKLVITGTITGLADKGIVKLMSADGKGTIVATAAADKNKFTLTTVLPEPAVYLLQLPPATDYVPVFAGNETITLTGNVNNLDGLVFKGSPSQADFAEYTALIQPLLVQVTDISQKASTGGVTDSLRTAYTIASQAILATADAFLNKKPSSPVSPLMLLVIKRYAPSGEYIAERYNRLTEQGKAGFMANCWGRR
jgi:Domain of unknown function (DUF4369)